MKLSKKAEYALRALTCLGAPGAPPVVSIQEIADQANIPKKFLEQVLLALKKAGLVHSSRGKAGGYSLHAAPARVTLGDIIQAVDGPFAPLPCADATAPVACPDCVGLEHCWLRGVMTEVRRAVVAGCEQFTLADLCRRAEDGRRRAGQALMYEI
ncbi:MAG: Rrf2 family transcriptional regulator [Desulfurellaceae bacterium]|nr:Rrf2 family transcriptional regulator [Desulfurellaceae bacterium]